MRVVVPDWVVHRADERAKRSTIYSVDVHPDGTRLATGGLDTKIRVWSTAPVLDDADGPLLLSTLARHTGAVLCVRWSHSGRFLASGSDDTVALVWELDTSGTSSGLAFGTSETNVEAWRPHRRLPGHESDVTDVAWSADDSMLATVGLDSLIILWSGTSFQRLRTIRGHHGFLKGVAFDPVHQFLATSSDDRTLKVWRTSDWGLEASVTAPFRGAPSTTFFHRPSWSPDGAHLLAANAMNGPVFVASVLQRYTWSSDIALVGHENAVTVTACSPQLFASPGGPVTVVALGSQDQSVSVWITGAPRPLFVAHDLFERHVMDLAWSHDGYTLYACSSDGAVAALQFDESELGRTLPPAELATARAAHGFTAPPRPALAQAAAPLPAPIPAPPAAPPAAQPAAPPAAPPLAAPLPATAPPARLQQDITRDARGKRRIRPTQMGETPSTPSAALSTALGAAAPWQAAAAAAAAPSPRALVAKPPPPRLDATPATGPTLVRLRVVPPPPTAALDAPQLPPGAAQPVDVAAGREPPSWPITVLTSLQYTLSDGLLRISNDDSSADLAFLIDGRAQWVDYVTSPVVSVTGTPHFCAVSLADGQLVWYGRQGERMASLVWEPCAHMAARDHTLAALSLHGTLRRWDVARGVCVAPDAALPRDDVTALYVHTNGVPLAVLRGRQAVLALDGARQAWTCVAQGALALHSSAWPRTLRAVGAADAEPVRYAEAQLHRVLDASLPPQERGAGRQRQVVATARHLEMRMAAAEVLDSRDEYRDALLALGTHLAHEGLSWQADALCRRLLGPIYHQPDAQWCPRVLGWDKRELLGQLLDTLRSGASAPWITHYQQALDAVQRAARGYT